jgi:hypothetical protein
MKEAETERQQAAASGQRPASDVQSGQLVARGDVGPVEPTPNPLPVRVEPQRRASCVTAWSHNSEVEMEMLPDNLPPKKPLGLVQQWDYFRR